MNTEISALYKEHGANPAGGCLPLFIQMPFLFAFYSMLGVALELRQAPFLWLHDLSSPDKLFILPVLIVISTLFVQKMTQNAGMDPAQQRMMTIMMPLMLGFFSWSLASGEPLLGGRQLHHDHSAVHYEPHRPWQEMRCGKARPQGRQVKLRNLPCR
jgi:YidC/Oxa1 family membrane protein insertase